LRFLFSIYLCRAYRYLHSFPTRRSSDLVPEHGTMFTLALVRFPPTATKEIQYLNAKGALTYTDIAGDPVLYGNLPPREISIVAEIGRAVQQECRDRSRMPSSA